MAVIGQAKDKWSWHRGVALLVSLAIAFGVAGIGAALTAPAIPGWYAALNKPGITPPNWVFGPAWALLYGMMGIAVWLVWLARARSPARARRAYCLYGLQLGLNLLWTVLFFGVHAIALAGAEILLLLIAIAFTITAFRRLSHPAGWLLVPYFLWVAYAASLNFGFWYLN